MTKMKLLCYNRECQHIVSDYGLLKRAQRMEYKFVTFLVRLLLFYYLSLRFIIINLLFSSSLCVNPSLFLPFFSSKHYSISIEISNWTPIFFPFSQHCLSPPLPSSPSEIVQEAAGWKNFSWIEWWPWKGEIRVGNSASSRVTHVFMRIGSRGKNRSPCKSSLICPIPHTLFNNFLSFPISFFFLVEGRHSFFLSSCDPTFTIRMIYWFRTHYNMQWIVPLCWHFQATHHPRIGL